MSGSRVPTAETSVPDQVRLLQGALDALGHPFYLIDASDYTIKMANAAARAQGLPGARTCYELTHGRTEPCCGDEHRCPLAEVKRTGTPVTVEHVHYDADGDARVHQVHCHPVFDDEGNIEQVFEYAQDSAESRRAERALVGIERKWHSLVENASDIVFLVGSDMKIQQINRVVPFLEREDVIGTSMFDYISPEYHDVARRAADRVLRTGGVETYEVRGVGPYGQEAWYSTRLEPVRVGGQILAVAHVAIDITERKKAEEALSESEEKWHSLVENAYDIIFFVGPDMKIQYINRVVPGLKHEDVIGTSMFDYISPEFYETTRGAVESVLRTGAVETYETRGVGPHGQEAWYSTRLGPVRIGGKVVAVAHIVTDITERKQAEEALRESEGRLRTLVTNAPVILLAFDREGVFTAAEGRGAIPSALTLEEHVGRSVFEVYRNVPEAMDAARRALGGEAVTAIVELRGAAFEARVTPVRGEDGTVTGAVSVATDVTERQRAEEAVKESEAKWRSLVENAPVLILILARDGTVEFANSGVPGVPLEEAIGSSIYDYAPPLYHDDMRQVFARIFEVGGVGDFSVPWFEPGGRTSWHSVRVGPMMRDGEVVALTIIATDITGRVQAEEGLRNSREWLRSVLENAPSFFIVVDRDRVVRYVNRTLPGVEMEDVVGSSIHDWVLPEYREVQREHLDRIFESGESASFEVRGVGPGGTTSWYSCRIAPIGLESDVPLAVVVTTDVTDRMMAEEVLQKAREELEWKVERQLAKGDVYGLTFRELMVLHLVAEGKSDRDIGAELGINRTTAQKHVSNILSKMQATSRTEAGVRAFREGLLS